MNLLDMISLFLTMLVKYFCYYFFMDFKQLHLPVKIYSGLDRVINHVMHDTSLVELLCKIRRYSSKSSFTYLVGRFLLIEEVGVKKSNLASATL